jgi:fructokinase
MVSRLGRDDLGRRAFDQIVSLGLDTTLLQWDDDAPTGTVQVSFDAQNDPDYVIVPNVAHDRIGFTRALGEAAARADCLCFGTLAQRASRSRAILRELVERARKAVLFLDVNLRKACYDYPSVVFSLEHAGSPKAVNSASAWPRANPT